MAALESGGSRQYAIFVGESAGLLKWRHKVDSPNIQSLISEDSEYARLSWPGLASHRRSVAFGECEEGKFRFEGSSGIGNDVRITREGQERDVGQIKVSLGKPSRVTLSDGRSYDLRNEGFTREEWLLVDQNSEPIFRVRRKYLAVEDSGEVEILGKGSTEPPMLLLMMAVWYVVR